MEGVLIGRYRVLGVLGAGGMGTTYVAEDTVLERRVAIKLLDPHWSRQVVGRFFQRIQAASAIRHPGLVAIYDVGYAPDERAYIVTELLEGESLAQRLSRSHDPLRWRTALEITRQVAGALEALHTHGIAHRELQPSNVFLVHDSTRPEAVRVKLFDIGTAVLEEQPHAVRTRIGMLRASHAYMAPEQLSGWANDARSDLYALGCMTYEMCCGQPPFLGDGAFDIWQKQLAAPVPSMTGIDPDIPMSVDQLVQHMLAKNPVERPASAGRVVLAIDALLGSTEFKPVAARRLDLEPSNIKSERRHKSVPYPWDMPKGMPIARAAPPKSMTVGLTHTPRHDRHERQPRPRRPSDGSRGPVSDAVATIVVGAAGVAGAALVGVGRLVTRGRWSATRPPGLPALPTVAAIPLATAEILEGSPDAEARRTGHGDAYAAPPVPSTPCATAYRPSWILPRRQSAIHVYVVRPEARDRVDQQAHEALDMRGNPARGAVPVSLSRAPTEGELLTAQIELAGFEITQPEPLPWRPPYIRFVVSIRANTNIALGVHRPVIAIRGHGASRDTLAIFDFDLEVRAHDRHGMVMRAALLGTCAVAATAAFTATVQHSLPPTIGWPVGAACVVGGVSTLAVKRTDMVPAQVRDLCTLPPRSRSADNDAVADVLIVTAVKEEYDAVLGVETGAAPESAWTRRPGPARLEVALREFVVDGGRLRIAVTQALGMGGVNAVDAAARLIDAYGVRCLAMCGVCAGRRGSVALGDVIVADRVWQYDTGKRRAQRDAGDHRGVSDQGDIDMYKIQPPEWQQAAERFTFDPSEPWLATRPHSHVEQGNWLLERLLHGFDPATDPAQAIQCADYAKVLARLWKRGLVEDGALQLTAGGREHIVRYLHLHRNQLGEPNPLEVRVGPIASGNMVMEDAEVFAVLADDVRKVLGVEMEAAAIGALAHSAQLPYSIVMKAVMDHADQDKSDNFKAFAARASAECLIAFLRKHLPLRSPPIS